MRTRSKFLALFLVQAIAAALASVVFAFGAIMAESARAEAELRPILPDRPDAPAPAALRARDPALPEAERLAAALDYADELRAAAAAGTVFRAQGAIEAAIRISLFSLLWAGAAAALFALISRSFTRRLDELSAGALRAGLERNFRFPSLEDREFGPVFRAFDAMLDRIAAQEERLGEAARLEGWKEVSSFLFHQLKTPLSSIALAARSSALAAERGLAASGRDSAPAARGGAGGKTASLSPEAALERCAVSAASVEEECGRITALLERFTSLAGLRLGPALPLELGAVLEAAAARLAPGRAVLEREGSALWVLGDGRMLEEAFLNLIVNAAEAAPSPPARIHALLKAEEGKAILELRDENGPVPPELFQRLGKERFSTKPAGTGLGLLFVRRVAALHGGGFTAYPTENGGFGVRISLPLAPPREAGIEVMTAAGDLDTTATRADAGGLDGAAGGLRGGIGSEGQGR